jgi:hypothetical protein
MRCGKILFLILSLAFEVPSWALTRSEVLGNAAVYAGYSWSASSNNILDVYDHVNSTSSVPKKGSDGRDDRAYIWDVKKTTWVYSTALWPFEVCSTCTYHGEAYAWGYGHHLTPEMKNPLAYYDDKSFKEYLAEKRVAGARRGELDRSANPIGELGDNADFTGMDCSGFATRALGFKGYHYNTLQLAGYSLLISTSDLKPGDLLDRIVIEDGETRGKHVMVVKEVYASSVAVYHATPNSFATGGHIRSVITETIQIRDKNSNELFLKDVRYPNREFEYYTYSPFPQFAWTSPTKENPHLDPLVPVIALEVVSELFCF